MSSALRLEITVLVAAIMVTCSHGLKIDFSRLSLPSRSYHETEKRSNCDGNPCDLGTPFLCRGSRTCIRLRSVCDGSWDCADGFDENSGLCNAAVRPPIDAIVNFLNDQSAWIIPMFFNGADAEMVAHQLTLVDNIDQLQQALSLTDDNVQNIRNAFIAAIEGDERPLLAMGMPSRSWPEVKYLLEGLYENGFGV